MLRIPVANTFMAKGVMPFSNPFCLGTIGLKARDLNWYAFEKADVVICVGYDMVEYHPDMWNPNNDKTIVHIDALPAEVDAHYIVAVGVLGRHHDVAARHRAQGEAAANRVRFQAVRKALVEDRSEHARRHRLPCQAAEDRVGRARSAGAGRHRDLRRRRAQDVDVAHVSRRASEYLHHLERFRLDGHRRARRDRGEACLSRAQGDGVCTGDAGFLMNSQEIETALRMKTAFVILIWNDSEYGLITWHQMRHFGRPSHIEFKNPDFVKYAESFGAKGYRIERTEDLAPTLRKALADDTVSIIDCPVDYRENMKLTEKLKTLESPL